MNLVTVENISKSFGDKILFKDITLGIQNKERIGLIGINGTGKSTFLKIIAGVLSPDEGRRIVNQQANIEYLPQNPVFDQGSTVLQQVFKGENPISRLVYEYEKVLSDLNKMPEDVSLQQQLSKLSQQMDEVGAWEMEANGKAVLTKLGITNFNSPVDILSGGQKKRVALARALIHPADLLILDEPTNHIDNETVEWLEEYLKKWDKSLLLITHDRYFLNRVTNRIIELDSSHLYSYEGNYETFLEKKAEREDHEVALRRKYENLLKKELAWLKRGAKARTTKQKARIQRVEKMQEEKIYIDDKKLEIAIGNQRLGKKVLEVKSISKSYDGNKLIDGFSYVFTPGERVGIIGRNGSGKSTLLNILAGRVAPDTGEVEIGKTVKLSYYDQENEEMDHGLRVIDYIKEVAEYVKTSEGSRITASQMLERFLFPPNVQWSPIATLSGGEKRRLYLLRKLMEEPNVLFLDEPTNDLDIQTLTVLEDYLDQFLGTIVIVSHDRYFLDRTVDHVFTFEENGKIADYPGNYSDYLRLRKENRVGEENFKKTINLAVESTVNKSGKLMKLSYKDEKEFGEIEGKIQQLEAHLAEVQKKVEEAGSNYELLQKYLQDQEEIQGKLDQTLERWMELMELVEEINKNRKNK